ncbi:hypothetical protein ZIOFF_041167 [Zingiber officinale]|uniref:Uncharacterized protein n=1 Tax=Zingiber officinale TaxID=94328 RepID=A0A8J5G5A0_ZINOF|nr:hypothetical protein ZIOFF_041167 [Zingiber officinale]
MKPRSKPDEDEADFFPCPSRKNWSVGLIKFISFLVIFMVGVVIGLSASGRFTCSFNSQIEIFFPSTIRRAILESFYGAEDGRVSISKGAKGGLHVHDKRASALSATVGQILQRP